MRGYLRRLAPAKTQTVIADKPVSKQPSRLHPTSCAFSQVGCFFWFLFFITELGEQMAGTGVPGCAEGLLKPAFKTDRPEQVAPASPPEGEEGVCFFFSQR